MKNLATFANNNSSKNIETVHKTDDLKTLLDIIMTDGEISVWKYLIAERKFYTMFGNILIPDGTTYEEYENTIAKENKAEYHTILNNLTSGKSDKEHTTFHFIKPETGEEFYYKNDLTVMFDENGKRISIIGTQRDVTEEVIQKRRLEEFKIKTKIINEKNHIIQWDYDITHQRIITHGNGAIQEGIAMNIDTYLSYTHPDDQEITKKSLYQMSRGEVDSIDVVLRIMLPGYDDYRYVSLNAILIQDNNENLSYTGIRRDITEDVLRNKELEEKTYKAELVTKASGIMPWEYDCKQQLFISDDNELFEREMTFDDYLKHTNILDKAKLKHVWDIMRECKDESFSIDLRYKFLDEWKYATFAGEPYEKDANGNVIKYLGYRNNTTEIALMNENIKESKFKTEMAIKNANMVMWEYNVADKMFTAFNDPLTNYDATAKYSPEQYMAILDPDSINEAAPIIEFMNRQELGEFAFKSKIMLPTSSEWQYITILGSHAELSEEDPTKATKYIGFRIDNTKLVKLSQSIEESNDLTSSILAQSPSAIFIKDITDDWRYMIANDLFCQLFDYTEDQIIGYTDYEIFDKSVAKKFREDDIKAIGYDGIYSFIEEITTNGNVKALHTTKRAITTGNGRQLLIGITSDLTETIAQQRALEKANKKSELILNNVNTGIMYIDNDFRVMWENIDSVKDVSKLQKYKRGSICHKNVNGLDEPCPNCILLKAKKSLNTEEETKIFEDGTVLKIFATPVIGDNNKINGYVCRIDNITDDIIKNRKLDNTQKYLDLAIEAGNVAVWGYNPKENIVLNISGKVFEKDVLPFDEAVSYIHHDDLSSFIEHWDRILSGESDKEVMCLRFKNPFLDKFEYVDKSVIAVRTASGKLDMIIGTHHDVTEDKIQKMAIEDSNEKLNMALDVIQAFSWHCDLRDQILLFDSNFISLGLEPTQMNSMYKFAQYIHADDRHEFLNTMNAFIKKNNGELISNYRIDLKQDGNYEWWECRGKMRILYENGQPYKYIYGMHSNIMRHKQITDEITRAKLDSDRSKNKAEEANALLQSIIRQIPFGLYIKDISNDFRYIIMNDVLANLDKIDSKNIAGKTDYELFNKEIADKFHQENLLTISRPDGELTTVRHYLDWHGEKCVYENSNTAITVSNGRRLLVGLVADITNQDRMLNELKEAKERAEQSDKLKSAFLANMSHEIRTPLNAIVGFSELLIDTEDATEREEYTNIISENNELLLRLIGDILDLSKIESGMMELKSEEFDISDICDEVYMMLKQKATNSNINFDVENPYHSCIVELDKNRLKQVGINFITNAIKYTAKGSITMGYKYVDHGIYIYVKDTGIGIAKENHDKVFERFEKFDSFAQGTGLGLSICKAIVNAQGGKIGFESEKGKGSYFWAWFPCDAQIEEKKEILEQKTESTEETSTTESTTNTANFKILIAEDNDSNYMLIKHILKEYNLTRACNGEEAVLKAKTEKFNAILMDWKMPIMNGLEATQKIREFDKTTPIIAVTANAFDSNKISILEAGCNDFVAKPLKKKELFDALNIVLK